MRLVVAINRRHPGEGSITIHARGCQHWPPPPWVKVLPVKGVVANETEIEKTVELFKSDHGITPIVVDCVSRGFAREHGQIVRADGKDIGYRD